MEMVWFVLTIAVLVVALLVSCMPNLARVHWQIFVQGVGWVLLLSVLVTTAWPFGITITGAPQARQVDVGLFRDAKYPNQSNIPPPPPREDVPWGGIGDPLSHPLNDVGGVAYVTRLVPLTMDEILSFALDTTVIQRMRQVMQVNPSARFVSHAEVIDLSRVPSWVLLWGPMRWTDGDGVKEGEHSNYRKVQYPVAWYNSLAKVFKRDDPRESLPATVLIFNPRIIGVDTARTIDVVQIMDQRVDRVTDAMERVSPPSGIELEYETVQHTGQNYIVTTRTRWFEGLEASDLQRLLRIFDEK